MNAALVEPVLIWTGKVMLEGRLAVPHAPVAAVAFATSPALGCEERDQHIIDGLLGAGVAVLATSLLSREELLFDEGTAQLRHDTELLAQRVVDVGLWLAANAYTRGLPVGYVASSGGAAGALVAAALRPDLVSAVTAIDGRTDLAVDSLRSVSAPTLLMVNDMPVLRMNREALARIRSEKRIEIVHGSDPETMAAVADKTVNWMAGHLSALPVTQSNS